MSETPLANAPEARTPTGEIKDVQTPATTESKANETTTTTSPADSTPKDGSTAKPADGEATSLLNKDAEPAAKETVPDKYSDFKVPEGVEIDKKMLEVAAPVFKELGLTQSQAQKLVDIQIKREQELSEAGMKAFKETRDGWRKGVVADSSLGDGTSLRPEVRSTIAKAIDGLGDTKLANDFRQAMDTTGAGDNPAFVRAFYKLAQQVTEGKGVSGNGPSKFGQQAPGAAPTSAAKALYPNLA